MKTDIRIKIRSFVIDNFLFGEEGGLTDETSFLDEGIVDSTGILELVEFLESEFSIALQDEELIPENLDSIRRVENLVVRKLGLERPSPGNPVCMQAGA